MGDIPVLGQKKGMLTVSDYVSALKKGDDTFGVEGYTAPIRDNFYRTAQQTKWTKAKDTQSFIQQVIKHAKVVPDPTKYCQIYDWRKHSVGKFEKQKKQTFID